MSSRSNRTERTNTIPDYSAGPVSFMVEIDGPIEGFDERRRDKLVNATLAVARGSFDIAALEYSYREPQSGNGKYTFSTTLQVSDTTTIKISTRFDSWAATYPELFELAHVQILPASSQEAALIIAGSIPSDHLDKTELRTQMTSQLARQVLRGEDTLDEQGARSGSRRSRVN
jgi:hypothetical protein